VPALCSDEPAALIDPVAGLHLAATHNRRASIRKQDGTSGLRPDTEPFWPEAGVSADPGDGRFCNPTPAVKCNGSLKRFVVGSRADEESINDLNALDYPKGNNALAEHLPANEIRCIEFIVRGHWTRSRRRLIL